MYVVIFLFWPWSCSLHIPCIFPFNNRKLELICERPEYWDAKLEACLFSACTTPQASTKFSPFCLSFGREAVFSSAAANIDSDIDDVDSFLDDEVLEEISASRFNVVQKARENIRMAQEKQKEQFQKSTSK